MDPKDLGRSYEQIIRVNSQSGKGGLAYVLQSEFGILIPKVMGPQLGRDFSKITDALGRELEKDEIYEYFHKFYVNLAQPLQIVSYQSSHSSQDIRGVEARTTECRFLFRLGGQLCAAGESEQRQLRGQGNGLIDALVHCIQRQLPYAGKLKLAFYSEDAVQSGADSEACTFVALEEQDAEERELFWGVGRDTDTTMASFLAVVACYNQFCLARQNRNRELE